MKKVTILIIIATIAFIYFVREGKRTALNSDEDQNKNLNITDYFFRGFSSTFEELTLKQITAVTAILNICFSTIIK